MNRQEYDTWKETCCVNFWTHFPYISYRILSLVYVQFSYGASYFARFISLSRQYEAVDEKLRGRIKL